MLMLAVLLVAAVLAAAEKETLAGPAPIWPAVIVSHDESERALQGQPAPAEIGVLPNPPATGRVANEPSGAAAQPPRGDAGLMVKTASVESRLAELSARWMT